MNNVRSYTDKQILDRVKSLVEFKGWPKYRLDVWIRSSEDAFNQFDDKVYSFDCSECKDQNDYPIFIMVNSGTSNAGEYGLEHFEEYNRLGCAVLKSDTIVYDSHMPGLHKGKPAYVQVKGYPYFRDADRDHKCDETGKEYNDIIGANCHSAGDDSIQIDNWSVACLVRNVKKQFNTWLTYMNKKPLTVSILKEFEV